MLGLLKNPKPCALLFVGEPGCGKTTMAMKFTEQLPAAHHHIRAQSADVATLDRIWDLCQYYPARGRFHVVHIDEVDGATEKAQLQLLSRMDATACLRPVFGGGFERGDVPPIIYIFTCNGRTIDGEMRQPVSLLPRFLSRCITLYFDKPANDLAKYLAAIWNREGGAKGMPLEFFEDLAGGQGVRDALMSLDRELLAPRSVAQVKRALAEKRTLAEQRAAANVVIFDAKRRDEDDRPAPAVVNKCAHKDAPHHSRGLCITCYRKFRREQRRRRRV
jgi:hypothetical protein